MFVVSQNGSPSVRDCSLRSCDASEFSLIPSYRRQSSVLSSGLFCGRQCEHFPIVICVVCARIVVVRLIVVHSLWDLGTDCGILGIVCVGEKGTACCCQNSC